MVSLLLENQAQVDLLDNNGYFPLLLASLSGYAEVVKVLLIHGAEVDKKKRKRKLALFHTSLTGHADIAIILIKSGGQVVLQDDDENSTLSIACYILQRDELKEITEEFSLFTMSRTGKA